MKLVSFLLLFFLASFAHAQLANFEIQNSNNTEHGLANQLNEPTINSATGQMSSWFNYGANADIEFGNTFPYYHTILFPDSTVMSSYTGFSTLQGVMEHSYGQVLDPTSQYFGHFGTFTISPDVSYVVDSVDFAYRYHRYQQFAPDTLVFQFFKETDGLGNTVIVKNHWTGVLDTPFAYVQYDTTLRRSPNPTYELKIPLSNSDSTSATKGAYIALNPPITIPAGQMVAATFTYYPGNPYNVGDTISFTISPPPVNRVNAFEIFYYEDPTKHFEEGVFSNGLTVPSYVRYNSSTNGWNGKYHAGNAYYSGDRNMNMAFHITTLDLSAKDMNGSIRSATLFPNPLPHGNTATLRFNLEKSQRTKTCVFDLAGKKISEISETYYSQGLHSIDVGTASLLPGMYFVKMDGQDFSIVKKLVVQ